MITQLKKMFNFLLKRKKRQTKKTTITYKTAIIPNWKGKDKPALPFSNPYLQFQKIGKNTYYFNNRMFSYKIERNNSNSYWNTYCNGELIPNIKPRMKLFHAMRDCYWDCKNKCIIAII